MSCLGAQSSHTVRALAVSSLPYRTFAVRSIMQSSIFNDRDPPTSLRARSVPPSDLANLIDTNLRGFRGESETSPFRAKCGATSWTLSAPGDLPCIEGRCEKRLPQPSAPDPGRGPVMSRHGSLSEMVISGLGERRGICAHRAEFPQLNAPGNGRRLLRQPRRLLLVPPGHVPDRPIHPNAHRRNAILAPRRSPERGLRFNGSLAFRRVLRAIPGMLHQRVLQGLHEFR